MPLPIAKISIRRFAAIEEKEFSPGAITRLRGRNGVGKSTVLNAILAAFKGTKGEFVREGESEAQVVVLLNDETTIERRIKREGKQPQPRIKPQGGAAETAPAAWLRDQVDDLINPLEFITAPPDRRLAWLLEALPVKLSADELQEAVGKLVPRTELEKAAQEHGLVAIEKIMPRVWDSRKDANVGARAKRASAEEFRQTLPPADDEDTDWAVVEQQLSQEIGAAMASQKSDAEASAVERDRLKREADADYATARERIIDDVNRRIEAIRNEGQMSLAEIARERDRKKSDADVANATRQQAATQMLADSTAPLSESLGTARAKRQEAERAANTRRMVARLEEEAAALDAQWELYNAAIQGLESLKDRLLERMPLEGIDCREGRIYRGGLPFEVLNTAQCIDIAMEVAELRAGKIGLVCVDGFERLDPENQRLWYERARNSGLHFIFTEVTGDPELVIDAGPEEANQPAA